MKKVIYIAYDGVITQSVFNSQVLERLKILADNKMFLVLIIGFENMKIFFKRNNLISAFRKNIYVCNYIKMYVSPRFPSRLGVYFNLIFILFFIIFARKDNEIILHCRGIKSAYSAIFLKKIFKKLKVIFDSRGVEPEEYVYALENLNKKLDFKYRRYIRWLKKAESKCVFNADKITCVSKSMIKHYEKKYKLQNKKLIYIPCCVNSKNFYFNEDIRRKYRNELDIDDKLVFVYSGSLRKSNLYDRVINIFNKCLRLDSSCFLIMLTNFQISDTIQLLKSRSIPENKFFVKSIPNNEVYKYLNASDIGFLIRKKNKVNEVACPTKLGEYISCGLYIITTDGVDIAKHIIKERKIGEVINNYENDNEIEKLSKKILLKKENIQNIFFKKRISEIGIKNFSWNSFKSELNSLYVFT